jgi:hypothetical protein
MIFCFTLPPLPVTVVIVRLIAISPNAAQDQSYDGVAGVSKARPQSAAAGPLHGDQDPDFEQKASDII